MIIAISGLKNSGKDTVADMLQYLLTVPKVLRNYWGYTNCRKLLIDKYKKVAFADSLKDTLSVLLGIPVELFYDREFKENTFVFVPTLSTTTEVSDSQKISNNAFLKCLKNKDYSFLQTKYLSIRQLMQCFGTEIVRGLFGDNFWVERTLKNPNENLIISDLRFRVELNALRKHNAIIIYINNPTCQPTGHASENEVLDMNENHEFDFVIDNNGSLEDLFNKVAQLCERF